MNPWTRAKAFMLAAAPWVFPRAPERIPYPVAVGAVCALHRVMEDATGGSLSPGDCH